MRVRSPADVIAAEATYGTPEQRYSDMLGIASAIANRAAALGVSPQDVISKRSEFNSYGRSFPPGASAYRSMAQRAIDQVMNEGPVHTGSFFATPKAASNLPSGLSQVSKTKGHNYYSDPYGRAINTGVGYRKPSEEARQQLSALAGKDVPTPTARPQDQDMQAGGLLGALAQKEQQKTQAQAFDSSRFAGPYSAVGFDASRFGTTQAPSAPGALAGALAAQAASAQTSRAQPPGVASFDANRFGGTETVAENKGILGAMLGQQNAARSLPAIDTPEADAAIAAAKTAAKARIGYEDPTVTTDYQTEQPAAYQPTKPPSPAEQAIAAQTATGVPPGGFSYDAASVAKAKQMNLNNKIGGLLGTLGPAVVGGILAGPLGGLLGGYIGHQLAGKAQGFPNRPDKPGAGDLDPSHRASVESRGNQDAVSRSPQARGLSKNDVGLF